jgi:hypothetical protein
VDSPELRGIETETPDNAIPAAALPAPLTAGPDAGAASADTLAGSSPPRLYLLHSVFRI